MDEPSAYTLHGWEQIPAGAPLLDRGSIAAVGGTLYAVGLGVISHVMETWRSDTVAAAWTKLEIDVPTSAVRGFALASDDAALFLSGGLTTSGAQSNQVWKFDGAAWNQQAASAAFPARDGHAMIKWRARLYIMGGRSGNTSLGDVWASDDDGATWAQVPTSSFTPRADLCTVVLGDTLYALGGAGPFDVLRSTDGAVWSATPSPPIEVFVTGSAHCAAIAGRIYYIAEGANTNCFAWSISSADGVDWQFEPSFGNYGIPPSPGTAVVGGRIYIASGFGTTRFIYRSIP